MTCWQAAWFCIQCFNRLLQQNSISLLELNVCVHAIIALCLLLVWRQKPHDVKEPTLITDDEGLDFCAAANITPFYQTLNGWIKFPASYSSPAGFGSLWIPCDPCLDCWEISTPRTVTTHYREESMLIGVSSPSGVCLSFGPSDQPCLKVLDTFWTIETRRDFWQEGEICELDSRCIKRLARAYRVAKEIESSSFLPKVVDRCPDFDWTRIGHLSGLSYRHFGDWFWSHTDSAVRNVLGLTLSGAFYGGLHLTAWSRPFPSVAEKVLWFVASVTILSTGFTLFIYMYIAIGVGGYPEPAQDWLEAHQRLPPRSTRAGTGIGIIPRISLVVSHIFCRAFIVAECFIMLAYLPDTILKTPQWAAYIPHIA